MLTGDKLETAENIGYSSKLINEKYDVTRLSFCTAKEMDESLFAMKKSIQNTRSNKRKVCVILDGVSLDLILRDMEKSFLFLAVLKNCESIICCRVTPVQKASVVRLVQKNLGKICLAIGDGGNDVNMIQEGNIGVGILGLEGMQAANASDFAIPEFRMLERLLFVHGR
jgi:phospholipid-transporting ATPase